MLLRPRRPGLEEELGQRFTRDPWDYLSRAEFASRYAAARGDLDRVERFAAARCLNVVAANLVRRTVVLCGRADDVHRAFGLRADTAPDEDHSPVLGPEEVPRELWPVVTGILASAPRPAGSPCQLARPLPDQESCPRARPEERIGSAREVADYYGLPTRLTGRGQAIGIIAPFGGFAVEDIRTYRGPRRGGDVRTVSVNGAYNARMTAPRPHVIETTADVQLAGSVAPGARIIVYFTPNDERGLVDVLSTAVHDARHRPCVLAISWGSAERRWSRVALHAVHQVLAEAAALGITVCAAAGNDGWRGRMIDERPHVEFPAADPLTLACGGTRAIVIDGWLSGERPWTELDGTGGSGYGLSAVWEPGLCPGGTGAPPRRRAVPDVCAIAGEYLVHVGGSDISFLGTSATAQIWAGLTACLTEAAGGPLGLLASKIAHASLGSCFQIPAPPSSPAPAGPGGVAAELAAYRFGLGTPRLGPLADGLRAARESRHRKGNDK